MVAIFLVAVTDFGMNAGFPSPDREEQIGVVSLNGDEAFFSQPFLDLPCLACRHAVRPF